MAWAFVGVSNVVEVTATSHALVTTGITGTLQAGDLLVACISSRIASTTSITLPTGGAWTLVSEQKNNNVLSTNLAAPSGLMAYCVRGASNPNLTFTHPVAPSVALGRIVAYRDVSSAAPKDTQTSFTTATAITAVSGAGLTTTVANDLIVAMAAGGQEAAWSAFNATSPAGASGATSTAAPTTTWLERADSLTTTGVDTSLAIFDAIKTAAGATGNLTATASVAAAHVVVAGAFKIGPVSISDAWDINNKSAGVTLTNNDRTATTTTLSGVRSTTTYASGTAGKYYAELVFDTVVSPDPQLGINRTANADITTTTETVRVLPATGNIILGGATTLGSVGACVSGDVICLAWDAGAERIWFRKNNGLWNNDAAADPSAGTNGLDVSVLENSAFALWMRNGNAGAVRGATVRAKNADFSYSGPSGFTSWMGETLVAPPVTGTGTPAAQASAVVGDGSVVTPSTLDAWSAADKSANVTLSNNDKTATLSSTVANSTVRSTQQLTNGAAGKYYAEFLTSVVSGGYSVGIKSKASTLTNLDETVRVQASDGQIDTEGASVVLGGLGSSIVSGDVVCVAWDAAAELIWFREGSGLWNNDAAANPATGTNGLDASSLPSSAHCLFFQTTSSGNSVTVRTEVADFSYSGPSGFTSWMGEALPVTGTGALSAQASAVSGVGTVSSAGVTGDGAAAAAAATVAGAGTVSTAEATGTGALAAQAADADGAGTISGALDAWNSADKSANITLSNNDKTATLTAAVTSGVRSTTKYLNGTEAQKFYVEFLQTNIVGSISNQVGLREASASLTSTAGSTAQCASNSGNILTGNATIIGNIGGSPLIDGDVVCMAWSPSTERIWFRKNNNLWNNSASADPATNTGGLDISVLNNTDHALFFLIASTGNGASTTIRTEAADLTYSAPSGFVSWMGEALSTPEATGTGALAAQDAAVAGAGLSVSAGDGAVNAQDAAVAGTGAVASSGDGALVADTAAVNGAGVSASTGTGNAAAEPATVAGTGTAAAANSGTLVAEDATVAGEGVSSSDGVGALAADAATIAGTGLSVSTGIGALACGSVTIAGVGIVLEEGVAVGTGELLAGAATISGEGEGTGEVAPPVTEGSGGYHYRPDRRPLPVEGYGYGIIQIEGEAHGVVGAAGRSVGALPRFAGQADAAAGAAGSSTARLTVKATAIGNAVARGRGSGMIVKFEGAAIGRHDDDEAAIVAWLLAA